MGVYIPEKRLKNLHTYAYSGADDSIISKAILGPYWNWLVTLVPTSIAPNTLTVSGLALVFLNFITLVYVDPGLDCAGAKLRPGYDARGPSDILAPVHVLPRFGYPKDAVAADEGNEGRCLMPWVFLTWSLCLFAYQSLDSIDGKQARRTGMAGPLGELFDHGCDAINTTLECLLACAALNVGKSYWSIAALVATLSNFYLTTWEEFHTGTLYLSAFSGPVEGILMICLVYLITGLAPQGARFWDRGILSVTGLETIPSIAKSYSRYNFALNDAFLTFGAVGLFANVVASYSNVVKARRANKRDPISPLLGLAPLVILLVCLWTWSTARGAAVLRDGQAYVALVCAFGLMFAYTVGLLIVAHVTKAPFPYFNVALGWAILGALDSAAEQ
ncbi:Choline/ethanolaminephosphotransferase [Acaromyces ingoldii]|uniref:Choline/ethanolaminephosphotransferase n=1 Tax=Acaromyces ingoldii TaxID=215250 RepID=A0A316YW39_9BASI|nr:Choline/ethanolaminephosphotransferase [Acaromyces ingoldii]PWN93401.1 Choline/ethanolaminephosphotransferase [Acaromyces ingoldii]